MSAFNRFYEMQFGKRSEYSAKHLKAKTDEDLRNIIAAGNAAEFELRRRMEWDETKRAALYAWNAAIEINSNPTGD